MRVCVCALIVISSLSRSGYSMDSFDSLVSFDRYCLSLFAGLLDDILCLLRVDECKFFFQDNQYWCVHLQDSTGKGRLWVRPCISGSAPYIFIVLGRWFVRWEINGWTASFVGCCFQNLFRTAWSMLASFLISFSLIVSLMSSWYNHTIVLTWPQFGRILILSYQRYQILNSSITCQQLFILFLCVRWDCSQ